MRIFQGLFKTVRPHQQIKNGAVILGAIATGSANSFESAWKILSLVISWIFLSGSVYIFNDISDYENDRVHPIKSQRTIASNQMSIKKGKILGIVLLTIAVLIQVQLGPKVFLICVLYFLINVAYSHILKNLVIIDLLAVSSGFVLRGLSGVYVVSAIPSVWFILLSIFGSLLLVTGKRHSQKSEAKITHGVNRSNAVGYPDTFLNQLQAVCSAGLLMSYVLMSEEKFRYSELQHTILQFSILPFLATLLYLNLYLTEEKESDVTRLFLMKKPLALSSAIWLFVFSISLVVR